MNPNEPERLDLCSQDIIEDKKAELLSLFPEILTEGGKIDFDRLKLVLGETVDVRKERYGMNWPGKADCFKTIQAPSMGTLLPCPDESVNFDTTENLIIEGDNLEVLKLLQKSYLGKIKMIYIDPPYNTGNDFIYPDNYTESLQTYLEYTGQVDSEGKRFSTNTEADGRFHSKWLNMMYSRLFMARNLLAPDGVTFVSIDDTEVSNLRQLMDNIFGSENFLGCISVISNLKGRSDDSYFATAHNYLLAYCRSEFQTRGVPLPEEYWDDYPEIDSQGKHYRLIGLRKRGAGARRQDRENMFFPIYVDPESRSVSLEKNLRFCITVEPKLSDGADGRWRWGPQTVRDRIGELTASQVSSERRWDVFQIDYSENEEGIKRIKPKTFWIGPEFSNEAGTLELKRLLGKGIFDTPKPIGLIKYCCEQALENDDCVLDFFAGSGTTAHAVMELNKQDGGTRRFILVQLPERLDPEDKKQRAAHDFCEGLHLPPNISELTKERIRRVIGKLNDAEQDQLALYGKQDRGFKVFKLAESNFRSWNANIPTGDVDSLQQQLDLHVHHIRENRTADDILYELLLKSGFPLTTPVEQEILAEKTVYSAAGGAFLICLERELTLELIRAIGERMPERVVCLDVGFEGNDQLKANAVQIFEAKGVKSFKTV